MTTHGFRAPGSSLVPGDFTDLAHEYAAHRPGYDSSVAQVLVRRALNQGSVRFVDLGAGTGIWTRQVASQGSSAIRIQPVAVEPNRAMRDQGRAHAGGPAIDWRAGSAEDSGLPASSADLLTMASALHWTVFDRASAEFARVLRPGGVFAALWNTRAIERDPLLVEIEAELARRVPGLERRSSGRSKFCAGLEQRLKDAGPWREVEYFEGEHVERFTVERYLGVWRSVNDARAQAGETAFADFLVWLERHLAGRAHVDATYHTLVWSARRA